MGKKIAFLSALCGLFLCIFFSWDFLGQNEVDGTKGLQYKLTDDKTSYIVRDIGRAKDTQIVIPSEYRGKPVTGIGEEAFKDCTKITSVIIPNSIVDIGKLAFAHCKCVETVTFGENSGLKSIGNLSFSDCVSLQAIDIPDGVTIIDGSVFSDCESLGKVVLHDNVTSIGEVAFGDCKSLISITLPKNLTEIETSAFWGSGLASITIPSGVTSISSHIFCDCFNLTSITIPNTVTEIGRSAFSFSRIKEIHFEGSKEQWYTIEKGEDWDWKTPSYIVYCTDGNIRK